MNCLKAHHRSWEEMHDINRECSLHLFENEIKRAAKMLFIKFV